MGLIVNVDGTVRNINYRDCDLEMMQATVAGYIQMIFLNNNKRMIINEEGKLEGLRPNKVATEMAKDVLLPSDFIVGNALVFDAEEMENE